MYYAIGRHLSLTVVGEQILLLDSLSDRYAAFPTGRSAELIDALGRPTDPDSRSLILATLRRGQFNLGSSDAPFIDIVHVPVAEQRFELNLTRVSHSHLDALSSAMDVLRAARRLKYSSFEAALYRHQDRGIVAPRGPQTLDEQACVRALSSFERWRNLVPVDRRCLIDSLALRDILWRRGVLASLVIGVQLDPFGAHCWLQHGALTLNEDVELTRRLTPIRLV